MKKKLVFVSAMVGITCWAQPNARRAAITGGGDPDRGRCTVEVVVDGAANIDIRGDDAMMRDVSGAPPQWRRFECTSAIPPGAQVRFRPLQGRGRQEMRETRDGSALVHIEDPEAGADTYAFELAWGREGGFREAAPPPPQGGRDFDRDRDAYYREREDAFRGGDWHARFFERVRRDIEHTESGTFPISGDEYRLARTKQELNELQNSWASGNYDRRALDDVIGAMQRVVADNRLNPRDRDVLNDDLNRLREFRDRNGWRQ